MREPTCALTPTRFWILACMHLSARRRSRVRHRSRQYHTQKGYSLVSVTLVGLLMVLIVLMMLFRAQSDQAIARAQFLKSQSLVLADAAGVTYQSFLLRYPDVASFNSDKWSTFANAVSSDCTLADVLEPNDIQLINQVANQGSNWQAINPKDLSQGQLRLVNYQYVPDLGVDPNQAPGTGILQVEGRARAKGSISEAFGFGSSRSRVELRFRVDSKPSETFAAGLSGSEFKVSGSQAKISANVCDTSGTHSSDVLAPYLVNLTNGKPSKIAYSNSLIPDLPPEGLQPLTGIDVTNLGSLKIDKDESCQLPQTGLSISGQNCNISMSETETTDASGHPIYKYNIQDLTIKGSQLVLGRLGNEIIHLYIAGNTLLESGGISVIPGTQVFMYIHGKFQGKTQNGSYGFLENSQAPENFQLYIYSDATEFNLDTSNSMSKAVVFAPKALISLQDVKVDGLVWSDKISISGNSEITQNLSNPKALKIKMPGRKRINPAFTWQQRETSG